MEGFEMFWTCIAGVYWSSNIATFQGISYPIGSMGGFTVYLPTWMIDVHGKLGKYTYREPSHGSLRGISYIYIYAMPNPPLTRTITFNFCLPAWNPRIPTVYLGRRIESRSHGFPELWKSKTRCIEKWKIRHLWKIIVQLKPPNSLPCCCI